MAIFIVTGGAWIMSLAAAAPVRALPRITKEEAAATIAALKPPKRRRPLITIIGINDATETTDFLVPYGILRRADVADVVALSTRPGPMTLFPALKVEPQATLAEFDMQHPEGADYVIVPAMSRDDDPVILHWIKAQAATGTLIIGVCAGAKILGCAGLLDGRQATTHWHYINQLLRRHPSVRYVPDRRFVVDRRVATTTGISASMPMSLTLIEAIAGRDKAEGVSNALGLARWDPSHDSKIFKFTRPFALTVAGNTLAFWNRERLGIELEGGVDEVSLALVTDVWSRTYRSHVTTFASTGDVRLTRNGIGVVPDRITTHWPKGLLLSAIGQCPPVEALDRALDEIEIRQGRGTANVVAMQLEYPRYHADDAVVSRPHQ